MGWYGALLVTAMMLAAGTTLGCGDVGLTDLNLSIVEWSPGASVAATLLVVPDGSGSPLTAARGPAGQPVDATIGLTLKDGCGDVIANFPREDMWLDSSDQGLAVCPGGSVADHQTDLQGHTTWTLPLRAGGHSAAGCRVLVNGYVVTSSGPLPLRFNSPDLNGDRVAGLADVARFAADYFSGTNPFEADLFADGVVNIADIGVLAAGMGRGCP